MADSLEAAIFPNVKRRHFGAVTVGRVEKTAGPLYREERWIGTCFLDRDQLPLTGLIYTEYRNSLSARVALTRRAASDISEIASHYSCPVALRRLPQLLGSPPDLAVSCFIKPPNSCEDVGTNSAPVAVSRFGGRIFPHHITVLW